MAGTLRPTDQQLKLYGQIRELDSQYINFTSWTTSFNPSVFLDESDNTTYTFNSDASKIYFTIERPCNLWVKYDSRNHSHCTIINADNNEVLYDAGYADDNPNYWSKTATLNPGNYIFTRSNGSGYALNLTEWFFQALPIFAIPSVEEAYVTTSQLYGSLRIAKEYIDNHGGNNSVITNLDSSMSDSSENPVKNNVIKAYVDNVLSDVPDHVKAITQSDINNWNAKADSSDIPTDTEKSTWNEAYNKVANLPQVTILEGTLTAGSSSVTITDSSISANTGVNSFTFYTSIYGVSPTNVTISNGSITLEFDVQLDDMDVEVKLETR